MSDQAKWDWRFIGLARYVSTWSKDPSTQVGAAIIRPDRSIVSTGYNGFPRGMSDEQVLYMDRELKLQRVVHAEVNAIIHARQSVDGCTMYVWPPGHGPTCDRCAVHVIQAGIRRVVGVRRDQGDFYSRWREACERAWRMYEEAGVDVVMYDE